MSDAPHVLIIEARFYEDISDQLAAGAIAAIEARGGTYERIAVPGALEIPSVIRYTLDGPQKFDAFVALGCVIRGETTHYDHVCQESIGGIHRLALEHSLCVGTGILTCENQDQAQVRAGANQGNKGKAAADAALDLFAIRQDLVGAGA